MINVTINCVQWKYYYCAHIYKDKIAKPMDICYVFLKQFAVGFLAIRVRLIIWTLNLKPCHRTIRRTTKPTIDWTMEWTKKIRKNRQKKFIKFQFIQHKKLKTAYKTQFQHMRKRECSFWIIDGNEKFCTWKYTMVVAQQLK